MTPISIGERLFPTISTGVYVLRPKRVEILDPRRRPTIKEDLDYPKSPFSITCPSVSGQDVIKECWSTHGGPLSRIKREGRGRE